jgi:hypothetical protein
MNKKNLMATALFVTGSFVVCAENQSQIDSLKFEELEEVIGGSSQSRYTIAEIEHGKEVGLAAFYFEDEILRGYLIESMEDGELPTQNDYTYYLSAVFS